MAEKIRVTGLVKWYDSQKGYGFLVVEGKPKDIFFHAKQWNSASLVGLPVDGEKISFTIEDGPKGEYATDLSRLGGKSA